MDRETRTHIQRATQSARRLLEEEYVEQLEGRYDIRADGSFGRASDLPLGAGDRLVRGKILAAIEHLEAARGERAEGVAGFVREAAFTTLNRFVALRMLEARGLVQPCISEGPDSSGFREFGALAPGLAALHDHGYRLYIESIFDEIGREVRVLFDRSDAASLLWPRRPALRELLALLDATELEPVWAEDETIGWVYQYFNGEDERKAMRKASQAPRSSRELAVRNQFFTPRYVVQFLTDNTLGRIWHEMMQGQTVLADLDYVVRHANECFLAEGEDAPDDETGEASRGGDAPPTVHVRHRAKKDPRDLRVLDPACGSGHFLLYAFDLMQSIYEEAWHDQDAARFTATGRTLREDYAELVSLRAEVPALVLRHNLFGIDIDPRAAQIAALALWMRAQRAFAELDVPRDRRARVTRTNIVAAEPVPGDGRMIEAFVADLDGDLARLVRFVFDRMALVSEAGSLLRMDEEIETSIRDIYGAGGDLFRVGDEVRWESAEADLHDALATFARRAAGAVGLRRRLFAGDAEQGLGFIDACRRRYDVVLMNPPFGAFSLGTRNWSRGAYPRTKNDIYAAFVERGIELLQGRGRLGAITSRTGFFLSSFQKWREEILLKEAPPVVVADLGLGVMDDALVEAAAYCLEVTT